MPDPAPLPWRVAADRLTVAQRIAAAAARDIAERRLAEGAVVTEVELAAAHAASRTPAREAMLQLDAWGLVRLLPKKGGVVTAVSAAERRDLLAVRAMFEADAVAALRAETVLPTMGERLSGALAAQREAAVADDRLGFAEADYAFHAAVIDAGGNAVVAELMARLAPRFARLTFAVALESPDRLGAMLEEHERLAALARDGDATGFAALLRAHLDAGHFPAAVAR